MRERRSNSDGRVRHRRLRSNSVALLISGAAVAFAHAAASAQTLSYPPARRSNQVDVYHGVTVADPYRWLEDTDSPETLEWVRQQNELTYSYLATLPRRDSIRTTLTRLWNAPSYGVPLRARDRLFFLANTGLQNHSILYAQDGFRGEPETLLDPNTWSIDGSISLAQFHPSPNGNLLAYGISRGGSDWREVRVRDVRRGSDLSDTLRWVKFSEIAWTKDNRGFFYARFDEPPAGEELTGVVSNQKLYFHRIGTPQSADLLILQRPDAPDLGFDVRVSEAGDYAIVHVWRGTDTRNMIYFIDLALEGSDRVTAPVVRLIDSFIGSFRFLHSIDNTFIFLTDLDAPNKRVVAINIDRPGRESWIPVVPEGPDVIRDALFAGDRLVLHYLRDASSSVRFFGLDGSLRGGLELPGLGTVTAITGRPDSPEIYYGFQSFLSPRTVFRYDMDRNERTVHRAPEVDFSFDDFETRQIFASSPDGTRIPIFVTARKGIVLDGSHPTILYGYGGFDISLTPTYTPTVLAWLRLGGIYAVANLRGGGEYGSKWHQAGTLENKQNVFDDFIAAAEKLVADRYTSNTRLAAMGASNGGLLVGAVVNQRPDLFSVALPAVGVMDMLRFHKFTIGWAWTSDYGSADDPEQFRALYSYSPLHNVRPGINYPATLVTTADHDDRVVPGHSFKYAATLQAAQAGNRPVLIRIQSSAGHGAGKTVAVQIEEMSDILAFAHAWTGGR